MKKSVTLVLIISYMLFAVLFLCFGLPGHQHAHGSSNSRRDGSDPKQDHHKQTSLILAEEAKDNENYEQAIEHYLEFLGEKPSNIYAYQDIALCYERIGKLEQAEQWLQKSVDIAEEYHPSLVEDAKRFLKGFRIIHSREYDAFDFGKGSRGQSDRSGRVRPIK